MSVKISIIGAGSAAFSFSVINSLCRSGAHLRNAHVCFMDIDRERLDTVYAITKRYCAETGMELDLSKTLDRREALRGAGFVMNIALAADHGRLREGWEIARKLGYRFGGSLHIIHDEAFWINFYQLKLMEEIVVDMLDICPEAWFVLVANPVQAGTTFLTRKYPRLKMVGMCHGFNGVYSLARRIGIKDTENISFECPGVNHFVWLTKFFFKGENALPMIDRWIEEKSAEHFRTLTGSDHEGPKPVDLYKRFGAFPIGDTANPGGGAWGWWYHTNDETEKNIWKENGWNWFQGYFESGLGGVREMRRVALDKSIPVSPLFGNQESHDPMIPLIEALACDREQVVIVNVMNDRGYVPGIPHDYAVEVPALVSARGVQPIKTDGLPKPIMAHLLRDRVAPVETELEAFSRGSRKLLVDLVMQDPWTRSMEMAEKLVDAILALPYHKEMKTHYK